MRRKFFALLIVCVTMLTQIGAPMAGVAAIGSGSVAVGVWCKAQALLAKRWSHAQSVRITPTPGATKNDLSKDPVSDDLPVSQRDHASCGFCETSVDATPVDWIAPEAQFIKIYHRLSFDLSSEAVPAFAPNPSAPARGPPAFS